MGNTKISRRRGVTVAAPLVSGLLVLTACGGAASPATQMRSAPPANAGAASAEALADPATRQPQMRQLIELVSAGGVGRLYTLNEQEAANAVTRHRMTRQPDTGIFLSSTPFEGSKPVYRLKPSATANRWLLTPSESEAAELVAAGWLPDDRDYPIVGYVHQVDGPGREVLTRFTNGSEWRVELGTVPPAAGYEADGPIGYVDVPSSAGGA